MRGTVAVIDLGVNEAGPHTRQHEPVDDARVHAALQQNVAPELADREHCRAVALRRSVRQKPGAARAPGVCGELLGLLAVRVRAEIDAVEQRGHVELQGAFTYE